MVVFLFIISAVQLWHQVIWELDSTTNIKDLLHESNKGKEGVEYVCKGVITMTH